jgi:hypothetical protein
MEGALASDEVEHSVGVGKLFGLPPIECGIRDVALELKLPRASQQLLRQVKTAREMYPRGQRQDERTRTAGHVKGKVSVLGLYKLQFLSQHFRGVAYRKRCEGVCGLSELLLNRDLV